MVTKSLRLFIKQIIILLAICLFGYFITPFANHFKGLGIGLAVSLYCMWLLARKVERVTENAANGGGRFASLGMASRVAVVLLGAFFMSRWGHSLIMWTFAAGVLGGYFLIVINISFYNYQESKKELGV